MKELIFTIFLLSPTFKLIMKFQGIELPFNLTLLFAPLLLMIICFTVIKEGCRVNLKGVKFPYSHILLVLLFGWALLTLTFSPSGLFSLWKTGLFFIILIIFIYPTIVQLDIYKFIWQFIIIASLTCPILFLILPILIFTSAEGSSAFYLILGEYSALIVLIIIGGFHYNLFRTKKIALYFFLNLHLILMIFNPGRGPIIFTVFILLIFFYFQLPTMLTVKNMIMVSLFLIVLLVSGYALYQQFPEMGEHSAKRIQALYSFLFEGKRSSDLSAIQRLEFWQFSVDSIFNQNPLSFFFGYGFGSFGILFNGNDDMLYPHNIFLEILFELGFVGFLIMFLFLVSIIFQAFGNRNYLLLLPLFFMLLNVQKSGTFVETRLIFSFMGLSIVDYHFWNKTSIGKL